MKNLSEAPSPHQSANPVPHYPAALPLPGVPVGQLDAFPPGMLMRIEAELVAEAIRVRDDRELAELEQLAGEREEASVAVELQRAFDFDRPGYMPPASEFLIGRRPGSTRRRQADDPAGLADVSDSRLARQLTFVWLHRGRMKAGQGLPEHDAAIQAEWLNRAAGFGIVRKLLANNAALPYRYVEHANRTGRRSHAREAILRLLMLVDAFGWNGITISEAEAEDAGICSRAQWWRAVGQLEAWGLLVHVRTYKAGIASPVGLSRNWYGPGPMLAELRAVYLADLGRGDKADLVAFDAKREGQRKRKAGERRRLRHARSGHLPSAAWAVSWPSAPSWHEPLLAELRAAKCFELGHTGIDPGDALTGSQSAQLDAALAAAAGSAEPSPPELGAVGASSAGGDPTPLGETDFHESNCPLITREEHPAPPESKLERSVEPNGVGSPPADDAPTAPSSGGDGSAEPGKTKAPACSDAPRHAAGCPRLRSSGPSLDRAPDTPAGLPKGRAFLPDHPPPQVADDDPKLDAPPGLFDTIDTIAARLASARCPLCGCADLRPASAGLVGCAECGAVLCPD